MERNIVVGIDGGGTNTRVMICDLNGNELAYAEGSCASKYKDENAAENVKATIKNALAIEGEIQPLWPRLLLALRAMTQKQMTNGFMHLLTYRGLIVPSCI